MSLAGATAGALVHARGREWVVLPGSGESRLRLRPLTGTEDDAIVLLPRLETPPPKVATFPPPDAENLGTSADARLLADALRLSLRRGAGPFRSAGRIGFEPRTYQLVPLVMALNLDPVRLLIADDVGIGKTVEAGLILREMWDRGEVRRAAILCPPHLVEQWTDELREKFDLHAVPVTATSAPRLERGLGLNESPFDAHPLTVVSLDYIKTDRRRADFARACPPFVIVDEAHTCAGGGGGGTQRHTLLKRLAEDESRHMVLLTATPHSGDEAAFERLLGLLDPAFGADVLTGQGRERLARHFVQRRRPDVMEPGWREGDERTFPKHEAAEAPFELSGPHLAFNEAVLDYCLGVTQAAGEGERERRVAFWGTLALMRCVGSSPAAALSTLTARRERLDAETFEGAVFDEEDGHLADDDLEPSLAAPVDADAELDGLIAMARDLVADPKGDPKLAELRRQLRGLTNQGHDPVIFCRFIATAEAVGEALSTDRAFKGHHVEIVTGRLQPDERRARVEAMGEHERRILVATDCLSEGINLQGLFDAVVHYDLSWNPTRHQQREGRVDRFGQPSPVVRSLTMFGSNSAIDGAVLDVILRKTEAIRRATNIRVSMIEDRGAVSEALMQTVLLRAGRQEQLDLFGGANPAGTVETMWRDAMENEERSRARFAQNRLRPAEVVPEWRRARELLGGRQAVRRFVRGALRHHGINLTGNHVVTADLPEAVRERLASVGMRDRLRVSFDGADEGGEALHRAHPLVTALADAMVEGALENTSDRPLARAGAWQVREGGPMRTLALLRVRHRIRRARAAADDFLLAEEIVPVLWRGLEHEPHVVGAEALEPLDLEPGATLSEPLRRRQVENAVKRFPTKEKPAPEMEKVLATIAQDRAAQLAEDHDRLSHAARREARTVVEPVLPPDVIGVFVMLPEVQ